MRTLGLHPDADQERAGRIRDNGCSRMQRMVGIAVTDAAELDRAG